MSDPQEEVPPWLMATTRESFDQDVLERSHEAPVIVDFWAPWCAPCRVLAPLLEKLAEEHEGRFFLVKANTEEVPDAAARFNVQGIPAVFAVIDGEVVDAFTGALPEDEIRLWLNRVLISSTLAEARRMEEIAPAAAEAHYRSVLVDAPQNAEAKVGLARVLLAQEQFEDCQAVIHELEQRGFLEPEAEKVKSALELLDMESGDLEQRRAAVEANPNDLELQLEYAESLAGATQYETALQTCLAIVQQDKSELRDKARQLMIDVFRVLPDESELTSTYRRKLSMALY